MLAPAEGWQDGATTDKCNDAQRCYDFDVEGSSHSRDEWVESIRKHIAQAQEGEHLGGSCGEIVSTDSVAFSEYWEDDTVGEDALKLSRVFWRRAQANKRTRD